MLILIFTLPNGRRVGHGTYVRAWRALQAMPADALVPGWGHFPTSAASILGSMRAGVLDRVNRHDCSARRGRKWAPEYQLNLARDACRVNESAQRIRYSGRNLLSTPELKRRFPDVDNPMPLED